MNLYYFQKENPAYIYWWLAESYPIDGNEIASRLFWKFFHTRWKILFHVRWDWSNERWDSNEPQRTWKTWKIRKNSKLHFGWRGPLLTIPCQLSSCWPSWMVAIAACSPPYEVRLKWTSSLGGQGWGQIGAGQGLYLVPLPLSCTPSP